MTDNASIPSVLQQTQYAFSSATVVASTGNTTSSVAANVTWDGDTVTFSAQALGLATNNTSANQSASTTAATQGTDTTSTASASSGDTVTISAEARNLAASQPITIASGAGLSSAGSLPDTTATSLVTSFTTQSGRQLSLSKYATTGDGAATTGQGASSSGYLLTIGGSGQGGSQSYLLSGDVMINEDVSGALSVASYTAGAETSGNDIIIGLSGNAINGGQGNDTLIGLTD